MSRRLKWMRYNALGQPTKQVTGFRRARTETDDRLVTSQRDKASTGITRDHSEYKAHIGIIRTASESKEVATPPNHTPKTPSHPTVSLLQWHGNSPENNSPRKTAISANTPRTPCGVLAIPKNTISFYYVLHGSAIGYQTTELPAFLYRKRRTKRISLSKERMTNNT